MLEDEEPVLKKGREKVNEREEEQEEKKEKTEAEELLDLERTPSGRVRRRSAQVAVFHLQEIAEDELAKDWGTKRRIKDDLVPDIKRVGTRTVQGGNFKGGWSYTSKCGYHA